jgi:antitoxin (DNA-binding transcriptional repressor) of toxin-antitoxin stability system
METVTPPELLLIDIEEAKGKLNELAQRAHQGSEIILTVEGKPSVMLTPPDNIKILSRVGAIYYELPRSMGGRKWLGPFEEDELDDEG